MIIALVLAGIFHPRLNAFMPADIAWAYALYLESVTVLPQLFMFQKQGKVDDECQVGVVSSGVGRSLHEPLPCWPGSEQGSSVEEGSQ